jgi:hypothetical protein
MLGLISHVGLDIFPSFYCCSSVRCLLQIVRNVDTMLPDGCAKIGKEQLSVCDGAAVIDPISGIFVAVCPLECGSELPAQRSAELVVEDYGRCL